MIDFTGCRLDFSVCEDMPEVVTLKFEQDGQAFDVTGAAWHGMLRDGDGAEVEQFEVLAGPGVGMVQLQVPALGAGVYRYEVVATGSAGDVDRVLYGELVTVTAEAGRDIINGAVAAAARTLQVTVPSVSGLPLQLAWLGSSVAGAAAAAAVQAAERVEAAVAKIEQVQAFIADFEDRVRSVIVMDPSTETWWIGGYNTGVSYRGVDGRSPYIQADRWRVWDDNLQEYVDAGPARGEDGKDGRDGETVVRHLVDSYEDIPQTGDTCNGGHYYYVPLEVVLTAATGTLELLATSSNPSDIGLYVNGYHVVGETDTMTVYDWAEAIDAADCGVSASTDGVLIWLTADEPGEIGNSITLAVGEQYGTVPATLSGGGSTSNGHDMYAWLVAEDGVGSWRLVDEVNSELYAGVKLSNDGRARVPGRVGVDDDGALEVELADGISSVRDGVTDTLAVVPGTQTLGVPWATFTSMGYNVPGVVRLGSQFGQRNPAGYHVGVGATEDHQLCNNLLYLGALQHWTPETWSATNQTWLNEVMSAYPEWFNDEYYLGLRTSEQFDQRDGLTVLTGTASRTGVFYKASSLDDRRANAVLTMDLAGELSDCVAEVYTREEQDELFLTISSATATYAKLTEVAGKVDKTAQWDGCVVLTEAEYQALPSWDEKKLYLIVEA